VFDVAGAATVVLNSNSLEYFDALLYRLTSLRFGDETNREEEKMIRNLRYLGTMLVAVLAMSSVAASMAMAEGALTSTGRVKLTGTTASGVATAFGLKLECHEHANAGKVNETPHGFVTPPLTSFTVQSQSSGCVATIGETKAPATVTTNGCDGTTEITKTISAGVWGGTSSIVCPVGKEIEIHAYTNSTHASTICTVKIPAQTGLTGGSAKNIANGDITLSGPGGGIKATKTGILCGGTAETNSAEVHGDAVVSGTNEAAAPTDILLSD
jgi:hypothetical protein